MIIEGAQSLEQNKQVVNALNVFPVPDGDTGTNMSLTMQSAVKEVKAVNTITLEAVANALANGSLMGARGNSGVILSQLFRGFAKGVKGKKRLSTVDLAKAFKSGSDTAYKAVMKPVEGTILTVARESAEKAVEIAKREKNHVAFLEKTIAQAEETLRKTPEMLKVLKDAGVVDSGGKGLIYIYAGALAAMTGKTTYIEDEEITQIVVEDEFHHGAELEFGYCTEFIIRAKHVDIEALKSKIETLGDSMLVVGNDNVVKVHIHTNHPGKVMEFGIELGLLADIKIDNMRLQHRPPVEKSEPQPQQAETKAYGMITVTMGKGLTKIFSDLGVDQIIEGGQTMNPSTEDFLKAIEEVNAETIYILPNNSNIIMAANQAKEISSKNIRVIPSKSVPQGITAALAFNPEAGIDENEAEMTAALSNVKTGQVTFAVRDTSFNDITIKKGDILGIGNGEIKAAGKGVESVSLELLKKMISEEDEIITLLYGEEVSEEEANQLAELIEGQFPDCDVELYYGGQPLYYYLFSVE
ncbi:DAK2 domain-containing protein [Alkaliphilus crotonatoxidans]